MHKISRKKFFKCLNYLLRVTAVQLNDNKMLKIREECDTYMTYICRNHNTGESPVKR